jgi:hypothetical protein
MPIDEIEHHGVASIPAWIGEAAVNEGVLQGNCNCRMRANMFFYQSAPSVPRRGGSTGGVEAVAQSVERGGRWQSIREMGSGLEGSEKCRV